MDISDQNKNSLSVAVSQDWNGKYQTDTISKSSLIYVGTQLEMLVLTNIFF